MISRFFRSGAVFIFLPVLLNGQVIFSRRVYDPKATTYQQIWNWNPSDGSLEPLTHSKRNHFQPSCSGNSETIRFLGGSQLYGYDSVWTFTRKTGVERKISGPPSESGVATPPPPVPQCKQAAAWAPGRTRFACGAGQEILIFDGAKKEVARAEFKERVTPPNAIGWSHDRKWLLVGTLGQNDNSTSRQTDYFILDTAGMKWIFAGSGNDGMWIPGGDRIVYSTPRDLVPLGKRHVWSTQIVTFDPATRQATSVTSGLSNNVHPAACVAPSVNSPTASPRGRSRAR